MELRSSSENDNIIQEGEVISKKIPSIGLPEVSKLICSIGNTVFLRRKKYCIKGKMDSLWIPRIITPIDELCYEVINLSISQDIFSYLKMLSMQCRKNIRVWDQYSYAIYLYRYIPMLYVMRMTQSKNDSINSILQYGRLVDRDCCVVFPASGFPYLILCPR